MPMVWCHNGHLFDNEVGGAMTCPICGELHYPVYYKDDDGKIHMC